jgi:hypothetical protein
LSLSLLLSWKQEGKEQRRYLQGAFVADPAEDLAKAR